MRDGLRFALAVQGRRAVGAVGLVPFLEELAILREVLLTFHTGKALVVPILVECSNGRILY